MNSYEFTVNGELFETEVKNTPNGWTVRTGQSEYEVAKLANSKFQLSNASERITAVVIKADGKYFVDIAGTVIELGERTEDSFSGSSADSDIAKDKVFAPMPGKIVKIHVQVGDEVTEKQTLAIVEAMKMENPVQAKASGKVKAVNFSEGDQVDVEQAIIELELE